MATRSDYRNLAGQCKEENCSEGGEPYEFGLAIDEKFCDGTAQQHRLSKTAKQWEIGELELRIRWATAQTAGICFGFTERKEGACTVSSGEPRN